MSTRSHNLRESRNFLNRKNIIQTLPKNTKFEVVERKQLASGAFSLKIKIISPKNLQSLNSKNLYVWESKNSSFKKISSDRTQTEGISNNECLNCSTNFPALQASEIKTIKKLSVNLGDQEEEDALKAKKSDSSLSQSIKNYSNSESIKNTIKWLEKNMTGKGVHACYSGVKNALLLSSKMQGLLGKKRSVKSPVKGISIVKNYFGSGAARNGVKDLKKLGFKNLLDNPNYKHMIDPDKAPKGAIIVYSKSNAPGHIEIKMDDGTDSRYGSDFVHDMPISKKSSRYKVIGVMIKPM